MASFNLSDRLRKFLQYAVPAACAADQIRSLIIVQQLAVQRLKEWEDEDNKKLVDDTALLLQKVVRQCQASDKDFWPPAVTAMAGVAPQEASTRGETADQQLENGVVVLTSSAMDGQIQSDSVCATTTTITTVFDDLFTSTPSSSTPSNAHQDSKKAADARGSTQDLMTSSFESHQTSSATPSPAPATQATPKPRSAQSAKNFIGSAVKAAQDGVQRQMVVYVTLEDVWNHVVQSLHFLAPPAAANAPPPTTTTDNRRKTVTGGSGNIKSSKMHVKNTPSDVAYVSVDNEFGFELEKKVIKAAESMKYEFKKVLPWPEAKVVRRSALRYAMDWQGIKWPASEQQPLERVLENK